MSLHLKVAAAAPPLRLSSASTSSPLTWDPWNNDWADEDPPEGEGLNCPEPVELEAAGTEQRTLPMDIPAGKHGTYQSTGAAWQREKRRRHGVESGWTNPWKKELQHAEKQLRQQQRKGALVSEIGSAQLKVGNMKERFDMWEATSCGEHLSYEEAKKKSKAYVEEKFL